MSRAKDQGAVTVYYDGACPLCRAEIGHYTRRDDDRKLRLVDVSRDDADLPEGLSAEAARARFHVSTDDGRLTSGARAFSEIWARIPGWRWAAALARLPGVLWILELSYRGFLKVRPAMVAIFTRLRGRTT